MPGWGQQLPSDAEGQDEAAATLPVSQDLRTSEEFGHFDPTQTLAHLAVGGEQAAGEMFGLAKPDAGFDQPVDSETLNDRYGVPGYLRFNAPTSDFDAAFQSSMAHERQFRDHGARALQPLAADRHRRQPRRGAGRSGQRRPGLRHRRGGRRGAGGVRARRGGRRSHGRDAGGPAVAGGHGPAADAGGRRDRQGPAGGGQRRALERLRRRRLRRRRCAARPERRGRCCIPGSTHR